MSWLLDFDVAIEPRIREKHTPPKSLPIHITDRIPIEIIDRIIKSLLHNLVAALRCGLVCKSWLALSRHYVFRDLNMGQEDRAAAFFRLLDSHCSTIRPAWLTAISLVYTNGEPRATQGPSNWNMLSSVRTLRIMTHRTEGCPPVQLSRTQKIRLENSFPCITSLTLRFALFRMVVDLAQTLHHLRHLEEVNLVDVVCHVSDPSRRKRLAQHKQSLRYPLPPGLRTFRVLGRSKPAYMVLRWLDGLVPTMPPIQNFAFESDFYLCQNEERLPRILGSFGPALHHIILTCIGFDMSPAFGALAKNTELRSLTITCFHDIGHVIECVQTFEQLASRRLERVEFHLEPRTPMLDPAKWADLRGALSRWKALENVRELNFWVLEFKEKYRPLILRELAPYAHIIKVRQLSSGPQDLGHRWQPAYSMPWGRKRGLI